MSHRLTAKPRVSALVSCPQFGDKAKAPFGRGAALGAVTPSHHRGCSQQPTRGSPLTSGQDQMST